MSCGLHDVAALELAGVPTAIIGTEAFHGEAAEQSIALGMPDRGLIAVPHPIQPLPIARVLDYADAVFDQILAELTGP